MTIDFLLRHKNYEAKLLKNNSIDIWVVTKNKIYPEINGEVGKDAGIRFVKGLVCQQFGKMYINEKGGHAFKSYHPDESDCPNGENLIKKWKDLNLEFNEC